MGYYDLASGAKTVQGGPPAVYTNSLTGTTIDTRGCDTLYCVVNMGTATGDGTMDIKFQEDSASGMGSRNDITSATFTQISTSLHEGVQVGRLNLTGVKRYVRVYGTYGGSGNVLVGVSYVMGVANSSDATTADFNLIP